MNWDAIGAVGEIAGAFAVFVSLVYLGVLIRNQNRETRAAAIHEISESFRESVGPFCHPDIADAFARLEAGQDISAAQRVQLNAAAQMLLRVWEEAYHQHVADRLDPQVWRVIESQYQVFLATKALTHSWELRKANYDPAFVEHVDGLEKRDYVFQ